jgi:hypothetical protein
MFAFSSFTDEFYSAHVAEAIVSTQRITLTLNFGGCERTWIWLNVRIRPLHIHISLGGVNYRLFGGRSSET